MEVTSMIISDYDVSKVDSITGMYEDISVEILGIVDGVSKYNPRYIYVAENIYNQFARKYAEHGADKVEFAMAWLNIGPKVDESLKDNQIRIEKGFIGNE